jgi:hypothetical protein
MKKIKEKNFLIKFFTKIILLITKFRVNSIGDEGAKELVQGIKTLIILSSLAINL